MKRVLLLPLLALMMGPAPGNTGGCGADSEADQPADFYEFCLLSRSYRCLREEARGVDIDIQFCVNQARDSCVGIAIWPESCEPAPRVRETEACIDELRRSDNLDLHLVSDSGPSDIPECRLCP